MPRICLFPGTFDPFTLGRADVIARASALFDEIVIGIGTNSSKKPMFRLKQRMQWCREIYKDDPKVRVMPYSGLTVDFCSKIKAAFILRGIRYVTDFEYEKAIADMNRRLQPGIETIFLTSSPEFATLASTLVRDVILNGGDASHFLPAPVMEGIIKK
jgi:pantetheine-phosphate adenylyltransferase